MRERVATTMMAVAVVGLLHAPARAQSTLPFTRVRPIDARARELLLDAWTSSPTVRTLVETIESSDLIVQIESQPVLAVFRARLRFMSAVPGCRYLRVSVKVPGLRENLLPALAHELQHAVEIAAADDVVDEQALADLLRRIGSQTRRAVFETEAAVEIEQRVRKELRFGGASPSTECRAPSTDPRLC